jgi:hypothetical protein
MSARDRRGEEASSDKFAIAEAIEVSGGQALVEHIAIDRSFVVDVLGVWNEHGRQRRVAFEVQVSAQTEDVTAQRTAQRAAECDLTIGVLLRHPQAAGWTVEGLGLPAWSDAWASSWPHLRVDHARTAAGLVEHTAAGTHIQWRSTDPTRIVAAIGTRAAVWLPSENRLGHAGWVTPRVREQVTEARAAAERAERREALDREAHARNRAAFIQRQEADVEALRAGLISRAAALTLNPVSYQTRADRSACAASATPPIRSDPTGEVSQSKPPNPSIHHRKDRRIRQITAPTSSGRST